MARDASPLGGLASRSRSLADSGFARAMNWILAAVGVAYAGYLVWAGWPEPGAYALSMAACAVLGLGLAAFDVQGWVRRRVEAAVFGRMVRRRKV